MVKISSLFGLLFHAILLAHVYCVSIEDLPSSLADIPENGRLKFCELANKYNLTCQRHNVTTEDGYILGLYNIPGNKSRPVLLQHGFLDSSDTFIIRTNGSLVAYLVKLGYDVWLGNMRGNMYSRAHVSLSPEGLDFWDFSFHEIALYDVPAMVNYVLIETGQEKLQAYIGHSEGTTIVFVLISLKPEYAVILNIAICLAPVAYLHNAESPIFPLASWTVGSIVSDALTPLGHGELLRNSSVLVQVIRVACTLKLVGYIACVEGFAFPVFGRDRDQLEPEFFRVAIRHYPCGTSKKNFIHLQQVVNRRQFAQFDYGPVKNLIVYKSTEPPVYELNKVIVKVALVAGLEDRLADIKDIQLLREELPNVVDYHVMERKEWNHIDFVWGRNMTELFVYIQGILDKYGH